VCFRSHIKQHPANKGGMQLEEVYIKVENKTTQENVKKTRCIINRILMMPNHNAESKTGVELNEQNRNMSRPRSSYLDHKTSTFRLRH
jgi:hypothetical protein